MQSVNVSGRAKEGICVQKTDNFLVVVVFWEEEQEEMRGAAVLPPQHTTRKTDKEGFLRRPKVSWFGGAFSLEYRVNTGQMIIIRGEIWSFLSTSIVKRLIRERAYQGLIIDKLYLRLGVIILSRDPDYLTLLHVE